ncbi:MAG: response regulator transcription factor [Clostridiaceae bacterium]|nr:response regulator transcription factor [Clostridiaceae bacterium]
MIQIAACDDDIDELSNIVQLISQYRASRNLNCELAAFPNGFELISAVEKGRTFDIYCLDIIMPGFTGIDAAKEIRTHDKNALILFLTSSSAFVLESYSVKAANYILKPVTKEKLFAALDEMLEHIKVQENEASVIVRSNEGIRRILIDNLVFVEVIGRNVLYHLRSGNVVECAESFSSACSRLLKYECFIRPHRSYLVNMQYVDTIDNHRITLQTRSSVPIAQGRAREVKEQYLAYQMAEE